MTDDAQYKNPFVPGARVAVFSGFRDEVITERFVDRQYKNGNFTLKGENQQWKPYGHHGDRWSALETGDKSYNRRNLQLWDAITDKELSAKMASFKLKTRWSKLYNTAGLITEPTPELCDAIEAALALVKSP